MSRISEFIFRKFHLRRASCDIPDHHHGFRAAGVVWHPYLWSPCYWNADAPVWRVWEALFRKWRAVTQCYVNLRSTSKSHRNHYFVCRQEFSNIAYCNIHARVCQGAVSNVTKNLRYTILTPKSQGNNACIVLSFSGSCGQVWRDTVAFYTTGLGNVWGAVFDDVRTAMKQCSSVTFCWLWLYLRIWTRKRQR